MTDLRILILGNSGSGKTTMAQTLRADQGLAHLDLDTVAWAKPGERLPLNESIAEIEAFNHQHKSWVIEGSYAGLVNAALPYCTELRFLNPGIEACVAHCKQRPWEPQKYASPQEQDQRLPFLLEWVRAYESRDDEYGYAQHRSLFERFDGIKHEFATWL